MKYPFLNFQNARCDCRFLASQIQRAALHVGKLVGNLRPRWKWQLSRDSLYQLANRFAWAWKIASLGVPVALVYLGFIAADQMKGRKLITNGEK